MGGNQSKSNARQQQFAQIYNPNAIAGQSMSSNSPWDQNNASNNSSNIPGGPQVNMQSGPTVSTLPTNMTPNTMTSSSTSTQQISIPLGYLIAFGSIINTPANQAQPVSQFPRTISDITGTFISNGSRTIIVTQNPNNSKEALFK